jgi:hypothetical protein
MLTELNLMDYSILFAIEKINKDAMNNIYFNGDTYSLI